MQQPPSTVLGIMHVECRIPVCGSLKEKRNILRRIIHHLRDKWNLTVSEVGDQDVWRSTILVLGTVSGERGVVEKTLRRARDYLDTHSDIEVVDDYTETW